MNLLDEESEDAKLFKGGIKAGSIEVSRFIPDTHMYRPSRIVKSLQYLTEVNVIRSWNDRIFDSQFQSKNKTKDLCDNNNDNLLLSVKRKGSN